MSFGKNNSKIDLDSLSEEEREYVRQRRVERRKVRRIHTIKKRILTADAVLLGVLGVVVIANVVTGSLNAKAENPSPEAYKVKSSSVPVIEGTSVQSSKESEGIISFTDHDAENSTESVMSMVSQTAAAETDVTDTAALGAAPDRAEFIRNSRQYKEIAAQGIPVVPDTSPSSITCLITRKFRLPSDYIPADLTPPDVKFSFNYVTDKRMMTRTAGNAMKEMFDAALKDGIELVAVSGYRSYERQIEIYVENVVGKGSEGADAVSAKPGGSEHQSGLTMDLSSNSAKLDLTQAFGATKEGKWLAENCSKYGFIIRYPKGKEKVTGYEYEPWHIRYVGPALSQYLYDNSLTLDEYYGITAEDE